MRPVDIVLNITNALFFYFHFFCIIFWILCFLCLSVHWFVFLILHNLIYCCSQTIFFNQNILVFITKSSVCIFLHCPFLSLLCILFLPSWAYGIYFNSYANVFAYKSIVCHFWSVYYLFLFVSLNGWLFLFGCCWVLDIFCTSLNIWDLVLILGINFILLRIITVLGEPGIAFVWANLSPLPRQYISQNVLDSSYII